MTWVKVDKVTPDITSYCVQNLATGNDYFFRITAENEEGTGPPLENKDPFTPRKPAGINQK